MRLRGHARGLGKPPERHASDATMYTRPGTGSGFNDGSSYASSSHYSGLPPGHGLPHGLPVTLSAHSSISGANRVVDALQHVDADAPYR